MDSNEMENRAKPKKQSPFADSYYESAYIEPEVEETQWVEPPKPEKKKGRALRVLLVIVMLLGVSVATAALVDSAWSARFEQMEAVMEERFDALKQLYTESQNQRPSTQAPDKGPMTPGEVYAKNVQAVVAITTRHESNGGYAEGSGSGFIISADGYIVTNYHVIDDAVQVAVTLHNDETVSAKIVGYESSNDIALLKIAKDDLPYVTMGSSDQLVVGDQVAAIGNPLGELTSTLTVGYISAKDRIVDTDGTVINMLQTDAAINAGNSGGPLFNMKGEVIGVITAKYSGSSNSGASIEGLGFAIPTDDIAGILSDLKEYGYVTGAYLGVYVRDVDASAQSYGLPAGAYVEEPMPGYAAEKGGIKAGDIIVNLGGFDVDSVTTLTRALRRFDAGETITVTVYRAGRNEYLSVTLGEKPVQSQQSPQTPQQPQNNNPAQGNDDIFDWFDDFFGSFFG